MTLGLEITEITEIPNRGDTYSKARELRYRLFFAMHDLPCAVLDDEYETQSLHFAALRDSEFVGYSRLTSISATDATYLISQVVVEPDYQSKGVGGLLLNALISKAIDLGALSIELSAREHAVAFYQDMGFETQGGMYLSVKTGIKHIKMVRYVAL